jgi:hypothetical protein
VSYTFQLDIHGVIAFVHHAKNTTEERVRIVVPNTLLGETQPGRRGPHPRKAVDDEDLLRHDPQLLMSQRHAIHLRGHRLEFDFGSTAPDPPTVRLGDAPKIREALAPGIGCTLADRYANATSSADVSAVLDITHGNVEAKAWSGHEAVLDRMDGFHGPRRAMAVRLVWTVEIEDDEQTVGLELRSLDGNQVILAHTLTPPGAGKTLELTLLNGRAQSGKMTFVGSPNEDHDFRWYYELLEDRHLIKGKLGSRKLPVPRCTEECDPPAQHGMFPLQSTGGQLCRPCEFCDGE